MKKNCMLWSGAVVVGALLIITLCTSKAAAEEASLRCSRCPAQCTSAHTYQVSCHNACRSVSPRLTQVRCENNRCVCSEPPSTTTVATTTTKKKKFFG